MTAEKRLRKRHSVVHTRRLRRTHAWGHAPWEPVRRLAINGKRGRARS